MKRFNKVAIVTGAASGVGKAIAELYAQEGAKVVVADLNEAAIASVVDGINQAGGTALGTCAQYQFDRPNAGNPQNTSFYARARWWRNRRYCICDWNNRWQGGRRLHSCQAWHRWFD
ncbi:NAD(P)-dependent dehydrogenase (short-subunit alcohol dehydrogenase family) [Paenibacillus sp. V4I7]|nr:NAD(P)-dependent dehydrogenase (short-subunit alcohol dehydrogenase family) [Paenibacillus sp. V4I7]